MAKYVGDVDSDSLEISPPTDEEIEQDMVFVI